MAASPERPGVTGSISRDTLCPPQLVQEPFDHDGCAEREGGTYMDVCENPDLMMAELQKLLTSTISSPT
jgi:hypothetical protein